MSTFFNRAHVLLFYQFYQSHGAGNGISHQQVHCSFGLGSPTPNPAPQWLSFPISSRPFLAPPPPPCALVLRPHHPCDRALWLRAERGDTGTWKGKETAVAQPLQKLGG
jgi:hypothetical protein